MREWCPFFCTAYMQDPNTKYCRLTGDGGISYTNCKRNTIVVDPSFIASIMTCEDALIVSSLSAWRILKPVIFWVFFQHLINRTPSFCFTSRWPLLKVWHSIAATTDQLRNNLIWTPESRTFWFNESRTVTTNLQLAALNYLITTVHQW